MSLLNTTVNNPWFTYLQRRPDARVRLFCFPYAGGSAIIFRNWADFLPAFIEVWPIQLPGRGLRLHEEPFTSMEPLVDALATAISTCVDKPFAFFGHSMGATISFELAHKLCSERGLRPAHLFVSARRAPQIPDPDRPTFSLPEFEFIQELRRLEGTPAEVLENQELLELLLPLLRSDFELIQTYKYRAKSPLACPITSFGGIADKEIPREHLQAWREQTSGPFRISMLPGNHFFLQPEQVGVLQTVAKELAGLLRR